MDGPVVPGRSSELGVVVPADFALDRELWRWTPDDVTLQLTRLPHIPLPVTVELARELATPAGLAAATRDLLVTGPKVVAYACTSGSFAYGAEGERLIRHGMTAAGADAARTTSGAVGEALEFLGVRRVAVVTPYLTGVAELLGAYLAEHGIEETSRVDIGLDERIWTLPPETVWRAALAADHPDAEALFISCTNVATYDLIAPLEDRIGKPVLTANQVTVWAALRAMGARPVGPAQRLIAASVEPPVPEPADAEPAAALYRVRVEAPDRPGTLASLAAVLAGIGCDVVSLDAHPTGAATVVDDLVLQVPAPVTSGRVRDAVAKIGRCTVKRIDAHEVVDRPTQALEAARTMLHAPERLPEVLIALLDADGAEPGGPASGSAPHRLDVRAAGTVMGVHRAWAAFTPTERARALAITRLIDTLETEQWSSPARPEEPPAGAGVQC